MHKPTSFSMAGAGPAAFTISVNGQEIGKTAVVTDTDHKGGGPGGRLLAHELTHLVQNRKPGKTGPRKITFGKIEANGRMGAGSGLQMATGKRVRISTGIGGAVEFTVQKIDVNVAQHEWTLTCEHIQRVQ